MAILQDPDLLIDPTDIAINTTNKTIELKTGSAITNAGSTGGVTGQCLYSALKLLWKNSSTYIKFPFPMEAITPESFEFINGWAPKDDTTRKLIRTAGWAEKNSSGSLLRKYAGIVSLGSLAGTDQPYFQFGSGSATNFTFVGPVNEAVQIYGDSSNGNFDYSDGDALTLFCREQGKAYASSNNTSIGASTLGYITYRFPLSNSTDLKISSSDTAISSGSPYTGITITYYASAQSKTIGSSSYNFNVVIEGNGATSQQIYEKIQYSLRQNSDIDAGSGTVNGKTASDLLEFVGDTLKTKQGVFIQNFDSNYTNSIVFRDNTNTERTYPFVAAGTITFGANAKNDTNYIYRMFLTASTSPSGNDYGTTGAIIVKKADNATDIAGTVSGANSVSWDFAFDSNTQGGRVNAGASSAPVPVTVVGIGLDTGAFFSTTYTITRTTGQAISLLPALERNYSNP